MFDYLIVYELSKVIFLFMDVCIILDLVILFDLKLKLLGLNFYEGIGLNVYKILNILFRYLNNIKNL